MKVISKPVSELWWYNLKERKFKVYYREYHIEGVQYTVLSRSEWKKVKRDKRWRLIHKIRRENWTRKYHKMIEILNRP